MKFIHDYIREHIFSQLGLNVHVTPETFGEKGDDLESIARRQTNWDFLYEVVAKGVIGWYRYGDNRDPSGKRHDHLARIEVELAKFRRTGNTEHLEEIAVYAMLETIKGPLGRGTLPAHMYHRKAQDDVYGDSTMHAEELSREVSSVGNSWGALSPTYVGAHAKDGRCTKHDVPLEPFSICDTGAECMDCFECYREHANFQIDRDFIQIAEADRVKLLGTVTNFTVCADPLPDVIHEISENAPEVAMTVYNPRAVRKLEVYSDGPPPRDDLADAIVMRLEETGIDFTECMVTGMEVDYGPDAPIQQEVVAVILDSRVIPEDNPLHCLVKAREADVAAGRIQLVSSDKDERDIPPFMREKKGLTEG